MALWFAGAPTSGYNPLNTVERSSQRAHLYNPTSSHLEPSTLEPSSLSKPYGKRRVDAAPLGGGVSEALDSYRSAQLSSVNTSLSSIASETPRKKVLAQNRSSHFDASMQPPENSTRAEGLRIVHKPPHLVASPSRQFERNLSGLISPSRLEMHAPFASDINNDPVSPYVGMKKKVPLQHREIPTDGDAFVLKRSRTPPPGAKFKETSSEGFCVLLASSLKSRANPQMVASKSGKGAFGLEQRVLELREKEDTMRAQARQTRCERALQDEQQRLAKHLEAQRAGGKGRARTPPPSVAGHSCPFALNLPVPRDAIGKASIRSTTPRRWQS